MNKLLVILGPTATGKTDLALQLAHKFRGELISADSRQVYKGLDIGTGKAPSGIFNFKFSIFKKERYWEINGIKIWMYDVVSPKRQYNVFRFVKDATKIIRDINKRGKLPILAGGTGLYIKAITEGLTNLTVSVNKKLRTSLEKLSLDKLQKKLQELSKEKWESLNESDRQNSRRLIRAIEIVILRTQSEGSSPPMEDSSRPKPSASDDQNDNFSILKIGLTAPREILYKRIDERVISRLNKGMIDEAIGLHKADLSLKRMKQLGLEYRVLADFLSEKIDKTKLAITLQRKIHGFARRQLTWFKKEKDVNWFDITDKSYLDRVENLIAKWYYNGINIKISTNFKKYAKKN